MVNFWDFFAYKRLLLIYEDKESPIITLNGNEIPFNINVLYILETAHSHIFLLKCHPLKAK